jgi:uncharacterized protein (TIGR03032 family)
VQLTYSRHFAEWLEAEQLSLAVTTYEANKLLLIGLGPQGQVSVFERTFPRCMGLWSDGQTLWMATRTQLWRLENVLNPDEQSPECDRLYVPRVGHVTGDLDIHDVGVDGDGQAVFVNTLFSCLATVDVRHNFRPLWQPPFISRLAAEDRCHLNGLAMRDGMVRYVTAAGRSDVADGWRDNRQAGGIVLDVESGQAIAAGLCMPHSPRFHEDRLWLLEAGRGQLGSLNPTTGHFEPKAFCPGFLRGLAITGRWAVVGSSRPRHEPTFQGLPLEQALAERSATARAGLHVVDLESGTLSHWLRIEGPQELYDVVVLPGVRRPKALGFQTNEIIHSVWFQDLDGQSHSWKARTTT